VRHRLLGLLAGPILIAQCGPVQCAPAPPPPPAVATTLPPPAAPTGSWSYLATDGTRATHWSACDGPITYQIDTTVAPTAAVRAAIDVALRAASAASGHPFVAAGDGGPAAPPGVDVVIGLRDYTDGTLGQGGGKFDASYRMVSGMAYVDVGLAPDLLAATLLHEIAHLLGLGHVDDPTQLLHPYLRQISATPPRFLQAYQAGDLEGLRRVGATATTTPCLAQLGAADEPMRQIILD
jgi:hypothetical protein